MQIQSNPTEIKDAEPLTEREVQALLNLYALKARIMEKKRNIHKKALGDLILLKEMFSK